MPEFPTVTFWLVAALMAALALAFVLPRLLRGKAPQSSASRRALELDVYRSQLADLARERDEGALSEGDYERARADVERRLLDETLPGQERAGASAPRRTAWLLAAALPVAAAALYLAFGTPAALDPATAVSAREDPAAFRESLARHLERHPADARSWVLLARAAMDADDFAEAARAYEKGLAASPRVARDPAVLCELADALGMANGGSLKGRPRELVVKALTIDPRHPRALEMAGSAAYEDGDYAAAAGSWRALLAQLKPGTVQYRELGAAIDRAELLARSAEPRAGAAK